MAFVELLRVVEQVCKEKGVKKEVIIEAIEQALLVAARKKYGPEVEMEVHLNQDTGEIEVYQFKTVVDDLYDEDKEVMLEEALKLDPGASLGDELGIKIVDPDFGRIDAQTAKQIIFQKVRDAERDIIYSEFIHRKGELVSGIARRMERGNLIVDLGKTDAILPKSGMIPGENVRSGDRVQAYLEDVAQTNKGPQILLTRTSPKYLMKLFEVEVPEIGEGIVEIKFAAREPGQRAKIAVYSRDNDVDPVGACVGMKGVRVQNVVQELRGEKIDIVLYSFDSEIFIKNALAPAEISSIKVHDRQKSVEVVVEDNQLSLAIGKRGQNVRLAAMLTGYRIDITSKSKLQKKIQDAIFNIKHIEGITDIMANNIYLCGYNGVQDIAEAAVEDLQRIPGYEKVEDAQILKTKAVTVIEKVGVDFLKPQQEDEKFTARPDGGVGEIENTGAPKDETKVY